MISIEPCKLDPIPSLRAGVLSTEQVKEIARVFINWNPATGSYPGLPGRLGAQPFKVRMRGPDVIQKSSLKIFESLDEHGQQNPVLLWARFGSLFVSYGGTRVLWALHRERELKAIVVDHDMKFTGWRLVQYEKILNEFTVPSHGVVPLSFGWKDGLDYVIADAREWQMMSEAEWEAAKRPKKARRKRVVNASVSETIAARSRI